MRNLLVQGTFKTVYLDTFLPDSGKSQVFPNPKSEIRNHFTPTVYGPPTHPVAPHGENPPTPPPRFPAAGRDLPGYDRPSR